MMKKISNLLNIGKSKFNLMCISPDCTVDSFWNMHTVRTIDFSTKEESEEYTAWWYNQHPLSKKMKKPYYKLKNFIVLDYGCGTGNCLVEILGNEPNKLIGIDISKKALDITKKRLQLYDCAKTEVVLKLISDENEHIELKDDSIDFINCWGVLQHTSKPDKILEEFQRILKPDGNGLIMVYNANSIWLHLYVAYEQMILKQKFSGMSVIDAFSKTTDSSKCPIARCWKPNDFIELVKESGLSIEYVGGYFSKLELELLAKYYEVALKDERLDIEHRKFLRGIVFDEDGYPKYDSKYAGIGGVYVILG